MFNFCLFWNTDWNSSGQKNNLHLNRKLGTRHVLKETKETRTLICSPNRPISERRNFDFWVFRSLKNEGKLCFEKSWQRQKLAAYWQKFYLQDFLIKHLQKKHVWSTAIILTSKNERQLYIKTIWLKVFKKNTLKKHLKFLVSWKFQSFSPILNAIFRC